jgi:hypothetical protein
MKTFIIWLLVGSGLFVGTVSIFLGKRKNSKNSEIFKFSAFMRKCWNGDKDNPFTGTDYIYLGILCFVISLVLLFYYM